MEILGVDPTTLVRGTKDTEEAVFEAVTGAFRQLIFPDLTPEAFKVAVYLLHKLTEEAIQQIEQEDPDGMENKQGDSDA